MVAPLLRGEALQRRYGTRTVLDLDSVELHAGEVLAVVGPNGAGKSTLFRILLLLERPDSGAVLLDGARIDARDRRARQRLAGVFQRPILFSGSVYDNVMFGLRARRVPRMEAAGRAESAIAALGLTSLQHSPVHALSGGEAQRVALARAVVTQPDVLLLDEPMASLDAAARRRFRQDIEHVARHHSGGIILITHDPADAFGLADRVLVLQDGRVIQQGAPDDILLRPRSPFVAELTGAELLLHGTIDAIDGELVSVRVAPSVLLWATWAAASPAVAGESAVVAYRPEDVMVSARGAATGLSAVNHLDVIVDARVHAGSLTRTRLRYADGLWLNAVLTRRSADALGLAPGAGATAHMKAAALQAWPGDDSARQMRATKAGS